MKKLLIIFLILIISNCTSDDTASDSQRSWCYSHAGLGNIVSLNGVRVSDEKRILWGNLRTAQALYKNDSGFEVFLPTFKSTLAKNTESSLELCKIWADMNEVE